MSSWLAMLQDAAEMFVFLAVELSLLFIVISAGVSLIRQKVPDHKIQQMMGARKGRGYLWLLCWEPLPRSVVARQYPCYVDCCQRKPGLVQPLLFYLFHRYLIPLSSD